MTQNQWPVLFCFLKKHLHLSDKINSTDTLLGTPCGNNSVHLIKMILLKLKLSNTKWIKCDFECGMVVGTGQAGI